MNVHWYTSRSKGKGRPSILSSLSRYSLSTHSRRKMNCFSIATSELANWSCWGEWGEGGGEGGEGGGEGGEGRGGKWGRENKDKLNRSELYGYSGSRSPSPLPPSSSPLQCILSCRGQPAHRSHRDEAGWV